MKRLPALLLASTLLFTLAACGAGQRAAEDEPFAACDATGVVIELYENQAVPYRWEITSLTGDGCLAATGEELREADAFPLAAGDAPAARCFSFTWTEDGVATIVLRCMRLAEYRESPEDYCKTYTYSASRQGDAADIERTEP